MVDPYCADDYNDVLTKCCVVLNNSWKQHSIKQPLYGHLPSITQTIQVRRTRHTRHCWASKDVFISDVFRWTPTHGHTNFGQATKTCIDSLQILDVVWMTNQESCLIGMDSEKELGNYVVSARVDDDVNETYLNYLFGKESWNIHLYVIFLD